MDVLRRDPAATCVITDFDGTLAAIVADPTTARPLPGAVATLTGLCARMGRVAVVSGRPAQFLAEHVLPAAGPAPENLRLIGLYGLEKVGPDGAVTAVPEAEPWRGAVEDAAARAEAGAPPGARVERKGLSVTLHWREHPEVESWAL
ncbi:MAG TPA: trehalose-phosphatase, partial [Acidimicrobiales bacterium]|nr:trehalose-phosphatase [Acidimicrobiales bacterium]